MKLNPDQQTAVDYDNHLLMLAPPGSGKSGTLIVKAISILRASTSHRLAMVTFTDAATKELKHRLEKLCTPAEMRRIQLATFHKHCINQLRKAQMLGRMLGPQETPPLIIQALRSAGSMQQYEEALPEIESFKLSLTFTGTETPVVEEYEAIRKRHRAMDLWDVVREAVLGMQRGTVQPLDVTHVLGDEWQDSDRLQQEWICEHASRGAITTIVADDDQSIYGWRRALGYPGLVEFQERVNAARVVLQINYRSNQEVLTAASAVIRHNTQRIAKSMLSARGPGGQVRVIPCPTRTHECDEVVKAIQATVKAQPDGRIVAPRGQWAVIARTNAGFHLLAGALRSQNIIYQRIGGKDKLPDIARNFCLLLASLHTGDGLGIEAVIRGAGVGDMTMNAIYQETDGSLIQMLEGEPLSLDSAPPEEVKIARSFIRVGRNWRRGARAGQYVEVIEAVAEWFLEHLASGDNDKETVTFYATMMSGLRGTLATRASAVLRDDSSADGAGVALHTMHSCKGLEFDYVHVIECNQGTIPSSRAESVEEERRLFFVAITRAKNDLTVSYTPSKGKSPFVTEMEAGITPQTASAVN